MGESKFRSFLLMNKQSDGVKPVRLCDEVWKRTKQHHAL